MAAGMFKLRKGFVFIKNGSPSKLTIVQGDDKDYLQQTWKFEPFTPAEGIGEVPGGDEDKSPSDVDPASIKSVDDVKKLNLDQLRNLYSKVTDGETAPASSKKSTLVGLCVELMKLAPATEGA